MYNYHVMVKMKYPDSWEQKVMNAPVKYFSGIHANAWDKKFLGQKVKSWNRSSKGYTCTESPLSEHCCLLYTSPSPRDGLLSRMPSSA